MDPIPAVDTSRTLNVEPRTSNTQNAADRLRETAQEFEGMFLGLLLKSMRGSAGKGGLFKEGVDTEIYREMFDQEIGRSIARAGGLGLAQMIIRDQALRQAGQLPGPAEPSGEKTSKVLPPSRRNTD
jgi:flagellar protein FlgJ